MSGPVGEREDNVSVIILRLDWSKGKQMVHTKFYFKFIAQSLTFDVAIMSEASHDDCVIFSGRG